MSLNALDGVRFEAFHGSRRVLAMRAVCCGHVIGYSITHVSVGNRSRAWLADNAVVLSDTKISGSMYNTVASVGAH